MGDDSDAAAPDVRPPSDAFADTTGDADADAGAGDAALEPDLGGPDQTTAEGGLDTVDHPPASPVLTLGAPVPTPIRGYTGPEATVFQDACPRDTVVIGFNVSTDDQSATKVVFQLQTVCGATSVAPDGTTVHVAMSSTLFLRGAVPATLSSRLCPSDQIVVGFEGHAFDLLDQLVVRCAGLTRTGTTVSVGPITTLPPAGGIGGTPFPRTDCPPDQIAVGATIGVRNWISAFGLNCAPVGATTTH